MDSLKTLAYDLCRGYVRDQKGLVGDEVADLVLGWIRNRDLYRLSNCCDIIPGAYHSWAVCRFSRQVQAFFKKNSAFRNDIECKKAAADSFERAERICRIANKRLDYYCDRAERLPKELLNDLDRAEMAVSSLLGDYSAFLDELPRLVRVTAGASATRGRRESLPFRKVRFRNLPATRSVQPYLRALASYWGYKRVSFADAEYNRVETVPKNWKTDRTIACEPEGNLFLQLAFDGFVKRKLLQWGINLSDQFRNQQLAREGSLSGEISTLDLSMASDTVSLNAIAWLIPSQWYNYLIAVRSPKGQGFGRSWEYAKLSSMGNGSTFAVETLIFAALCKSVGSKIMCVYGDDIVIETHLVPRLKRLLKFLGFQLNEAKSYTEGPFRESCGADWFSGRSVTPFYLRDHSSRKTDLCHVVNGCASLTHPGGELARVLLDLVEQHRLPLIAWNESSISGVWITPHDAYSKKLIRTRHQRSFVLAYTPKTGKSLVADSRTLFLWHLDASRRAHGEVVRQDFNPFHIRQPVYVRGEGKMSCIIRSSVPTFTHKYVRKWVGWLPPAEATPAHLYWWSDLLVRRKAD